MTTGLASLTLRAREDPKSKFISLAHLLTEDFLRECFWELKRDKASGVDGVSVQVYGVNLEENLKGLVGKLKAKQYRPQPVRRVYIPKPDGSKRGLGIPAVEDKIVQMGIKKILEAIFEVDFMDVSFGFRPNRSCHDALDVLDKTIMTRPVNYVVDMDIEKFFDTIDHGWLMRCLRERIRDTSLLRLIGRFLKAGVMEEGKYIEVNKGTPQGGIISPILANIYLHYILDLWFEKAVKKQFKGYAQLIRYGDDFIVCFQSSREAKDFEEMLGQRLDKFGLRIAEGKSRVIGFGRYEWEKAQQEGKRVASFDFLGTAYRTNLLIAGRDILSCNIVGAAAVGIKPEEVAYLREFSSLKGRSLSLDAIEVKGETLKEIARPLKWHLSVDDIFHQAGIQGITVQHEGTDLSCCSGCVAILSAFCGVFCKDNPGMALDGLEICMGEKDRPKKESKKVFLLGNCAIAANKDFKDGIKIKGCPPPILNTVMTIVLKSLPPKRVAKILMSRMIKNIGIKMGIYDEAFPAFGVHKPSEFDRSHF